MKKESIIKIDISYVTVMCEHQFSEKKEKEGSHENNFIFWGAWSRKRIFS